MPGVPLPANQTAEVQHGADFLVGPSQKELNAFWTRDCLWCAENASLSQVWPICTKTVLDGATPVLEDLQAQGCRCLPFIRLQLKVPKRQKCLGQYSTLSCFRTGTSSSLLSQENSKKNHGKMGELFWKMHENDHRLDINRIELIIITVDNCDNLFVCSSLHVLASSQT